MAQSNTNSDDIQEDAILHMVEAAPPRISLPAVAQAADERYSIFSNRQKGLIVLIVSVAATFSGFASNIYFPALPTIAEDLGVKIDLVNLTVTSYLIFQGLAPSLWGPVSDVKGRRIAYACTFVVFLGACIGLAETRNYATLIVLRCLQSAGSASTIAIGSGVIGDVTTRADRGSYMGIFQAGLLVPVAVGPIIGGALAGSSLGWRSIFWFLAIYGVSFLVALLVLLPETLRSRKHAGVRNTDTAANDVGPLPPRKDIDLTAPFCILARKHAAPLIIFLAVYYAVWQMSITAMSSLFKSQYGLSETQVGLTFIANGVGSMVGTLVTGKILDKDYGKVKSAREAQIIEAQGISQSTAAEEDRFPIEKARLRLVPIFSITQCLSIILFGWCIEFSSRVSIAIPIISTFITGWAVVSTQSVIMTYLVDVFPASSAAASASLNLARCLLAAGGTGFIMPMIDGIGVGWAFTTCAIVQISALSLVFVTWRFAGKWRQDAAFDVDRLSEVLDGFYNLLLAVIHALYQDRVQLLLDIGELNLTPLLLFSQLLPKKLDLELGINGGIFLLLPLPVVPSFNVVGKGGASMDLAVLWIWRRCFSREAWLFMPHPPRVQSFI
ncbi:MFS general substrate transporter [Apiospora kogelbergensis]|uniref:MFS general substrate transporter n=1 Tax=Apiospora kogelbergensis TaxID=1337665 RepID=UPI0031327280